MALKLAEVVVGNSRVIFNLTKYGEISAVVLGNESELLKKGYNAEVDKLKRKYSKVTYRLKLSLRLLYLLLRRKITYHTFSSMLTLKVTTYGNGAIQTIIEIDGDVITKIASSSKVLMDIHSKNVELATFLFVENIEILLRLLNFRILRFLAGLRI